MIGFVSSSSGEVYRDRVGGQTCGCLVDGAGSWNVVHGSVQRPVRARLSNEAGLKVALLVLNRLPLGRL